MHEDTALVWKFPCCPEPPDWYLDWEALERQFRWIQAMDGVQQDPFYHAEGDVLLHTRMVATELARMDEWRALADQERTQVFASALLHDVAKPQCTRVEENGHISSRKHARKGEFLARRILWRGEELASPPPFAQREQIARLVRFHGLPLHFLDKPQPERVIIAASMSVRLDYVAMLAEADVRGRVCDDQAALLEQITLFRGFCQELDCSAHPYQFASAQSRFVYFHSEQKSPAYVAYDDTRFEVVLLAGLPGVGKDTWIKQHLPGRPVVSLDEIRKQLRISPAEKQGRVVQEAKERARAYMRQQQDFVWNATNVTHMLREQLIDFFVSYGARVCIVYLDAPLETIMHRNSNRANVVPDAVINDLLERLEVPDLTEAHTLLWESV